jgi:hypothetical protein
MGIISLKSNCNGTNPWGNVTSRLWYFLCRGGGSDWGYPSNAARTAVMHQGKVEVPVHDGDLMVYQMWKAHGEQD